MSEPESWKQLRKGTRSCTECRRRKVRCLRNEDAESCQNCEDRGTVCIAQTLSKRHAREKRFPSRYRISQLETELASLHKAVREIQSKLGYEAKDIIGSTAVQPRLSSEPRVEATPSGDDSDGESSGSDVLTTEQPPHLWSLFENDWLTVETGRQDQQLRPCATRNSMQLLSAVRHRLQKLIPPREEVMEATTSSNKWIDLVQTLIPQPSVLKPRQKMSDRYESMLGSDIDIWSLASWLIDLAVSVLQRPSENDTSATGLNSLQSASAFARAVSNAVERSILYHDRLLGTIEGIGMAIRFVRLQMGLGNVRKAWIRLRHVITIAELLGLPKASQSVHFSSDIMEISTNNIQQQKAQLWEVICSGERLAGLLMNRPPITKRLQSPNTQAVIIDGVVQPRIYLNRLADIAAEVHYLDEVNSVQNSRSERYSTALELDRQLRVLASQTPKLWWDMSMELSEPQRMIQSLHYYVLMRVHLPFTIHQPQCDGDDFAYSRLVCVNACEVLAQRYLVVRRLFPPGLFLSPVIDMHAFSAIIVLLLLQSQIHGPSPLPLERLNIQPNSVKIEALATQVLQLMEQTSNEDIPSSKLGRYGARTIRSLSALLQQQTQEGVSGSQTQQQLRLKVPLLGTIHIHRNNTGFSPRPSQNPSMTNETNQRRSYQPHPFVVPIESQTTSNWHQISTSTDNGGADFGGLSGPRIPVVEAVKPIDQIQLEAQMQTQQQWQPHQNYISWSIQDDGHLFEPFQQEDTFMAEDYIDMPQELVDSAM